MIKIIEEPRRISTQSTTDSGVVSKSEFRMGMYRIEIWATSIATIERMNTRLLQKPMVKMGCLER
jgi:hypothetical protein